MTEKLLNGMLSHSTNKNNFYPKMVNFTFEKVPVHEFSLLSVPKAKSITYAQIPFYLSNLSGTDDILNIVLEIRAISDEFTNRGLPNYPSGIPFTFWEQYIKLRFYLMLALLCILVVTFLVLSVVLMNPWLATIIVSISPIH